ncbi:MAG: HepT-like ribonuclease domain-containing protein [Clostridia bacterium]
MDNKVVADKVRFLKKYIIEITDCLKIEKEKFCENSNNVAAAQTYLYNAVQTSVFLALHTLQKSNLENGDTYYKVFEILCRNGKLSAENMNKYVQMLDVRNSILFDYDNLTAENIYEMMENNIKSITLFLKDLKSRD